MMLRKKGLYHYLVVCFLLSLIIFLWTQNIVLLVFLWISTVWFVYSIMIILKDIEKQHGGE